MEFDMTQAIDNEESLEESQDDKFQYVLEVHLAENNVKTFRLRKGANVAGRLPTSDICLDNKAVSQKHLCVHVHNDYLLLEDLGSRNKTKKGKVTLVPHVRYNLEQEEQFSIGGMLMARVLEINDESDTCSESLLPPLEEDCLLEDAPLSVSTKEGSPASQASTVACRSPNVCNDKLVTKTVSDELSTPTAPRATDDDDTTDDDLDNLPPQKTTVQDNVGMGKCEDVEFSSQNEFSQPPMPNLNFTQQEKSTEIDATRDDVFRNMPTQALPSLDGVVEGGEESTQVLDVDVQGLVADGWHDERKDLNESMEFRCAPTQALSERVPEEGDFYLSTTRDYDDAEELKKGTHNKTAVCKSTDKDADESFVDAPTQELPNMERNVHSHGQSAEENKEAHFSRHFLVSGTETENWEESVLCEATQPDRSIRYNDDVYCTATQELCSMPRQNEQAKEPRSHLRESIDETPPGSPQEFVQETPPNSPKEKSPSECLDVVPESDEEGEEFANKLSTLSTKQNEESEVIGPVATITSSFSKGKTVVVEKTRADRTNLVVESVSSTSPFRSDVDTQRETQPIDQASPKLPGSETNVERTQASEAQDEVSTHDPKQNDNSARYEDKFSARLQQGKAVASDKMDNSDREEATRAIQKEGYEKSVVVPEDQRVGTAEEEENACHDENTALDDCAEDGKSSAENVKLDAKKRRPSRKKAGKQKTANTRVPQGEEDRMAEGPADEHQSTSRTSTRVGKLRRTAQSPAMPEPIVTTSRTSGRKNAGKNMGDILSAERGAWLIEGSQGNQISNDPSSQPWGKAPINKQKGIVRKGKSETNKGTTIPLATAEEVVDVSKNRGKENPRTFTAVESTSDADDREKVGGKTTPTNVNTGEYVADSCDIDNSPWVPRYVKYPMTETQDFPSFSELMNHSEEKQKIVDNAERTSDTELQKSRKEKGHGSDDGGSKVNSNRKGVAAHTRRRRGNLITQPPPNVSKSRASEINRSREDRKNGRTHNEATGDNPTSSIDMGGTECYSRCLGQDANDDNPIESEGGCQTSDVSARQSKSTKDVSKSKRITEDDEDVRIGLSPPKRLRGRASKKRQTRKAEELTNNVQIPESEGSLPKVRKRSPMASVSQSLTLHPSPYDEDLGPTVTITRIDHGISNTDAVGAVDTHVGVQLASSQLVREGRGKKERSAIEAESSEPQNARRRNVEAGNLIESDSQKREPQLMPVNEPVLESCREKEKTSTDRKSLGNVATEHNSTDKVLEPVTKLRKPKNIGETSDEAENISQTRRVTRRKTMEEKCETKKTQRGASGEQSGKKPSTESKEPSTVKDEGNAAVPRATRTRTKRPTKGSTIEETLEDDALTSKEPTNTDGTVVVARSIAKPRATSNDSHQGSPGLTEVRPRRSARTDNQKEKATRNRSTPTCRTVCKKIEDEDLNSSAGSTSTVSRGKKKSSEEVNLSCGERRTARVNKSKPKVLFTGLDGTEGQEIVQSLGGCVAQTVNECTHLVTDKFRRTVKALCCIAMGVPIVSICWLQKCRASGSFIDYLPYLLRDETAQKNFGFDLETTLMHAAQQRLLRDWNIYVTGSVKPPPEDMQEIIVCAGGRFLHKIPQRLAEKTVIVSCEQDKKVFGAAAKKAIPVVSSEFVLTGLLQYKIDVDRYVL